MLKDGESNEFVSTIDRSEIKNYLKKVVYF